MCELQEIHKQQSVSQAICVKFGVLLAVCEFANDGSEGEQALVDVTTLQNKQNPIGQNCRCWTMRPNNKAQTRTLFRSKGKRLWSNSTSVRGTNLFQPRSRRFGVRLSLGTSQIHLSFVFMSDFVLALLRYQVQARHGDAFLDLFGFLGLLALCGNTRLC